MQYKMLFVYTVFVLIRIVPIWELSIRVSFFSVIIMHDVWHKPITPVYYEVYLRLPKQAFEQPPVGALNNFFMYSERISN